MFYRAKGLGVWTDSGERNTVFRGGNLHICSLSNFFQHNNCRKKIEKISLNKSMFFNTLIIINTLSVIRQLPKMKLVSVNVISD